jgi:hypothetical protein
MFMLAKKNVLKWTDCCRGPEEWTCLAIDWSAPHMMPYKARIAHIPKG